MSEQQVTWEFSMVRRDEVLASVTILVLIVIIIVLTNYVPKAPDHIETLLKRTNQTFHIPYHGIIHIGARHAEELEIYDYFKIKDILWVEADPTSEDKLRASTVNSPGSKLAFFAATDKNGTIELHRTTNDGHSSSILKLKNHLYMSPTVQEDRTITVKQRRLDDYLTENSELKDIIYNIIVIDIQGAELIALKGASKTLQNIDAVISEVNYDELYAGAVLLQDLDAFLLTHNFVRADTLSINRSYGNALYVKNKFFGFKN